MTNRVHSLTVALDANYRKDDMQALINAILQFRGVIAVDANIADPTSWVAEQRARTALQEKISDVLWPRKPPAEGL